MSKGVFQLRIEALPACPQAVPISLGLRILRADTAAITAISVWMAQAMGSGWR
ncbi:MAG: 16S rRNA (uracil(1498)-N(3))-methyltransferase [Sphingorhabdus sp.]